jgi:hypothetical protein
MTIPTASVLLDRTAHSAGPNIGLAGMATLFACALLALLLCCSVVLLISRFCVLFLDFFLCLTFYHFLVSCFTFVAFRLCSFFSFFPIFSLVYVSLLLVNFGKQTRNTYTNHEKHVENATENGAKSIINDAESMKNPF